MRIEDLTGRRPAVTLVGHRSAVRAVSFSPDGRTVASGSADGVLLWDPVTGARTGRLTGHVQRVIAVAYSPDGRTLATASWIGPVRLWDVALPTPGEAVTHICRVVNRDLSVQERAAYLPPEESPAATCS